MKTFRREASSLFLLVSLGVIPVLFRYNYQDITSFKAFFYIGSCFVLLICGIIIALGTYSAKRQWGMPPRTLKEVASELSPLDTCVILFGVVVFLSCVTTRYSRFAAFIGNESVYVGGLLLVMACVSYFILSRYVEVSRITWIYAFYLSSFIVILLGFLNHMLIDPLSMHKNNARATIYIMASTVGNVDFFYGYVAIVTMFFAALRLGMKLGAKSCAVDALLFICFMCMWTARASGVFPGLAFGALVLAFVAMGSFERFKNLFWEGTLAGIAGVGAVVVHSFNEMIYFRIETEVSGFLMEKKAYIPFGVACFLAWLALTAAQRKGADEKIEEGLKKLRAPYAALCMVLIFGVMGAVVFIPSIQKLTGRQEIWQQVMELYRAGTPREKLIGIGPASIDLARDGLKIIGYTRSRLETAHNELVEYFLTIGAGGALAYLGIMVTALLSYFKVKPEDDREWEMGCAATLFAAFIGQGLTNGPYPLACVVAFTMLALLRRHQIPEKEEPYLLS